MKNLPLILSSLALLGVGYLLFSIKSGTTSKKKNSTTITKAGEQKEAVALSRIAYIDLDTLESKYTLFNKKKVEFEAREKKIENELQAKAKALEASFISFQEKVKAGNLSQAEGEKMQNDLLKRKDNLENLRNNLGTKLLKDQDAFNKQLKKKLDEAVAEYNKDNQFDYVLSYSKEGSIIHVNKELEITQEIVDIMNASDTK